MYGTHLACECKRFGARSAAVNCRLLSSGVGYGACIYLLGRRWPCGPAASFIAPRCRFEASNRPWQYSLAHVLGPKTSFALIPDPLRHCLLFLCLFAELLEVEFVFSNLILSACRSAGASLCVKEILFGAHGNWAQARLSTPISALQLLHCALSIRLLFAFPCSCSTFAVNLTVSLVWVGRRKGGPQCPLYQIPADVVWWHPCFYCAAHGHLCFLRFTGSYSDSHGNGGHEQSIRAL
jgi:hypothetical protein